LLNCCETLKTTPTFQPTNSRLSVRVTIRPDAYCYC